MLFLTERSRKLFSFGIGLKGQLGVGKIENRYELTPVDISPDLNIVAIAAGGWHCALIDDKFNCYLWGWNLNGQVSAVPEDDDDSVFVLRPTRLVVKNELSGQEVKFKAVSLGARHTALVDTLGRLYTFGWNKYGQLFMEFPESDQNDDEYNLDRPVKVEEFTAIKSIKCSCWLTAIVY